MVGLYVATMTLAAALWELDCWLPSLFLAGFALMIVLAHVEGPRLMRAPAPEAV
jgi:hypothetical protein